MSLTTATPGLLDRLRDVPAPLPVLDRVREQQLTDRQRDLLDRLVELFDEGFAHLTMADLAARLNCSLRTLYELAPSRDELVLTVIDRNQKIILGETEDLLRLEPIQQKWESFGWAVHSVDGHDFEDLHETFSKAGSVKGKPTLIIADTIKGKGISFMEDRHDWHYTFMDEEHAAQARKDLQIVAPTA